jgi:hypothetical protein
MIVMIASMAAGVLCPGLLYPTVTGAGIGRTFAGRARLRLLRHCRRFDRLGEPVDDTLPLDHERVLDEDIGKVFPDMAAFVGY